MRAQDLVSAALKHGQTKRPRPHAPLCRCAAAPSTSKPQIAPQRGAQLARQVTPQRRRIGALGQPGGARLQNLLAACAAARHSMPCASARRARSHVSWRAAGAAWVEQVLGMVGAWREQSRLVD